MNLAISNASPGEGERHTPFSTLANKQLGRNLTGGKPDDTTVVVGYVVRAEVYPRSNTMPVEVRPHAEYDGARFIAEGGESWVEQAQDSARSGNPDEMAALNILENSAEAKSASLSMRSADLSSEAYGATGLVSTQLYRPPVPDGLS